MVSKKAAESKAQQAAQKLQDKFQKHGIDLTVYNLREGECQLTKANFMVGWYWKGTSNLYLKRYSDTSSKTLITGEPRKEVVECMANIIKNERHNKGS